MSSELQNSTLMVVSVVIELDDMTNQKGRHLKPQLQYKL